MRCSECSLPVQPVVALDIDGVLGEYHEHLLRFMDGYFNKVLRRNWDGTGNWEDYLGLTQHDYREAKLAFRQGGMKRTMPLRDGAFALAFGAARAGAEVWITTTRPYNRLDSVDPDTREWLRRNNIYYDHLLYDDHKYDRLAEIVDADRVVFVLDDLPEMWEEAERNFGDAAYLLSRQHNSAAGKKPRRMRNLVVAQQHMFLELKGW